MFDGGASRCRDVQPHVSTFVAEAHDRHPSLAKGASLLCGFAWAEPEDVVLGVEEVREGMQEQGMRGCCGVGVRRPEVSVGSPPCSVGSLRGQLLAREIRT